MRIGESQSKVRIGEPRLVFHFFLNYELVDQLLSRVIIQVIVTLPISFNKNGAYQIKPINYGADIMFVVRIFAEDISRLEYIE